MNKTALHLLTSVVVVLLLIYVLYHLTLQETDPCAELGAGTGAAILAEEGADQEALTNRAIVEKAGCPPPTPERPEEKPQ